MFYNIEGYPFIIRFKIKYILKKEFKMISFGKNIQKKLI
jgi:hypothetical protein